MLLTKYCFSSVDSEMLCCHTHIDMLRWNPLENWVISIFSGQFPDVFHLKLLTASIKGRPQERNKSNLYLEETLFNTVIFWQFCIQGVLFNWLLSRGWLLNRGLMVSFIFYRIILDVEESLYFSVHCLRSLFMGYWLLHLMFIPLSAPFGLALPIPWLQ